MGPGSDTLIIGAGIVGLAVGFELARRGQRVIVLERGQEPGRGGTAVAAGLLAPASESARLGPALTALARASMARLPELVRGAEAHSGLRAEYRRDGALWVAFDDDEATALTAQRRAWDAQGWACTALAPAEVLAREPHLAATLTAGVAVLDDHHIDPRGLARALAGAIERLGGSVRLRTPVQEVIVQRGRACGVSALCDGAPTRLFADAVVLAAGAWSSAAVASPLRPLRVRPVRGQLLRLRGPPLLRHVLRTARTYIVPAAAGELWVGATVEQGGFSGAATAGAVAELLHHGARALPGLRELEFLGCAVGMRPAVRDLQPVVGAAADTAGLFVATGHYRDGVLLCAATAHLLAELMVSGVCAPELAALCPGRLLAPGDAAPPPAAPAWRTAQVPPDG